MSASRSTLRWLPVVALVLTGCTVTHASVYPDEIEGPFTAEIENREFSDMRVYAVGVGNPLYLGTVPGMANRTFIIPRTISALNHIGIVAVPLASTDSIRSPIVFTAGGRSINWRLERASFGQAIFVR
jgi:hypothetical protein